MGGASTQCSGAGVKNAVSLCPVDGPFCQKDAVSRLAIEFVDHEILRIAALTFGISIVLNIEFPGEIGVLARVGMEGGNLVIDRLLGATCIQNKNPETGFGQIGSNRSAARTRPHDDIIVFVLNPIRERARAIRVRAWRQRLALFTGWRHAQVPCRRAIEGASIRFHVLRATSPDRSKSPLGMRST